MIVIKKDVAEEISKSLKGNKNIFTRGDFDEFKISDEELKESEKEIEEDSEILDKSYTKREFVSGNGKRKSYYRTRTYEGLEGKNNVYVKNTNEESETDKIKRYLWENGKRLTDKKFLDLSKREIKKVINRLRSCHYYDKDGIHVAYGRDEKLAESVNTKELKGAKVLRDLGLEVFLLPDLFAYGKNGSEKKSFGDAIVLWKNHIFDFKQVDGENAGNNYKDAMAQGHDCLLYITNPKMNFKRVKDQILWAQKYVSKKRSLKADVFVYFEETGKTYLLSLDKTGKIKREVDLSVYKVSLTKAIDNDTLNLINTEPTSKLSIRKNTLSSKFNKSNEYSTKRIKEEFQKDFTVNISDITENNKAKKIDQLEKALTCAYEGTPFRINHIPADNSKNYCDVTLRIRDFDKSKIEKAVRNLSFSLDVPLKAANGEVFYYKSQEDLTNIIVNELTMKTRAIYDFVIGYFGLPERTIMSKAYLKYKGKILYSPETGEPINKRDWKKFIKALETFLNRNHRGFGKRIVLTSRKLGTLLKKMSEYQTKDKIRKLPLTEIKEPRRKTGLNWSEPDPDRLEKIFVAAAEKWEQKRIEVAEMSAAQKITKIDDVMKNDIQQILIDGIKNKKSKGQVSQALFDRCAGLNRDIQRIADTEIQNNVNNAFIAETVRENEDSGKKTYFIRREVIDGNTCEKCKKLNGKIAVWSNTPLENEKVKDPYAEYAIWEGKDDWNYEAPNGVKHPYCYSDDTEVMTNNGWKLFKDVTKEDLIMSINPETKEIDFVRTVRKVQYDYNGKMILFPGRNYNQLVTPDHNMLYVARNGHGEDHLKGIKAEDLIKRDRFSLPRAIGNWKKEDKEEFVNFGDIQVRKSQLFRLWGWYLSEGSGRYKNHENKTGAEVKLAQKIPERIIVDLPDLKDILHIGKGAVYFYGKYAAEFSSMFGIHAEQKYIPDFIKNSSKENILNFLNAFMLGDGSCVKSGSGKGYSKKSVDLLVRTSSPKMANDLCEIIVKAGFMPSVNVNRQKGKLKHFRNGDYVLNTDCYNISICTSKNKVYAKDQKGHLPSKHPEYVDYNGKVYDVELEKWHFLLVKRNGKCAWSGNCRGVWDSFDPEYDEKPVEKSLTFSGFPLQGRKKFAGFNISIENKKGSYREGTDSNGHKWRVKMYHDYGYIRGSVGTDGDHVDCYLGPNENAKKVYIVHQQNPDTKEYDEDKCMLGFDTQIDAKNAYLKQYDRPGFLQSITVMDLEEFRSKVLDPENKGKMIKSMIDQSYTKTIQEIINR